jgi:4-hydroxybenzoate polyprenyltransferase
MVLQYLKTTVFEYAKLSSAHFIFLTAIIPVTGAIAMGQKDVLLLTLVFLIGLTAHIFGFAFNHYKDIEVDRLSSQINKRPLLSGTISKQHALFFIVTVLLLGCVLTVISFGILLLLLYIVGVVLAGLYDMFSKRITGMDVILAAAVVVGVIFGAGSVSFQFPPFLFILCVLAFLQTLNLNLIAGGLKDADHDYLINSHHLSTRLGVRVKDNVFHIPSSFRYIAYILSLAYAFFVLAPVLLGIITLNIFFLGVLVIINILFFLVTAKMLHLKKFQRQQIRTYIVLQYTINWSNIPILLISIAPLAGFLLFYPIIGLIISNLLLYRTVFRSQVM